MRAKLTHPALAGGVVHLVRDTEAYCWRPTVVVWPDQSRQDALRALESVGLAIEDYRASVPRLVDQ